VEKESVQQRGHYRQQLDRGIHVLGNVMMTISGVAPTASVFILAPIALWIGGTGAFWAFIVAGIIGIGMSFAYAEAGTAFPVTGGEWALVSRCLGRPIGFISLVFMLISVIVIPSSLALGAGQYLSVVWDWAGSDWGVNVVAAVIMLVVGGLAVLQIKTNSVIQGILLGIELIAIGVITVLGFMHGGNQSGQVLVDPIFFDEAGSQMGVNASMVMFALVFAIFAYNGYGGAIVFSEETKGARRNVARAILWTLLITVVVEIIPLTAAIVGAPSLQEFLSSGSPMQYILTTLGNETVNTVVSLLVFVAIFNSCLAIVVLMSRIIFGSGRDKVWPEPISAWLAKVHPKYKSPWVAALFMAVVAAILCATTDIMATVTFTGVMLAFTYLFIAFSSIAVRIRFKDLPPHYKMPLWPVFPIISIGGVGWMLYRLSRENWKHLVIAAGVAVGALLYYYLYLKPRPDKKWIMLDAVEEVVEPSTGKKKTAS
jgi:amino acid transporter